MEPREHQLETIAGHGILKSLIRGLMEKNQVPHAMLFHGPEGIGKKSTAFAVAKYINCQGERGARACRCSICSKISRGAFVDLTILEPEGPARVIKIDKIRQIHDSAYITPIEGEKKVVLLFQADRMSLGAANSLLKILEEPPRHLILILTTNNPHNLLPTTRSRCMPFRFSPLPTPELRTWLMKSHGTDEALAEVAALLSEGRPGPALEISAGDFRRRREEMIKELDLLKYYGFPAIFRVADRIASRVGKLNVSLNDLLIWHRDLLVSRLAPEESHLLVNKDMAEMLAERSANSSVSGLFESFKSLLDKQPLSRRIIHTQLALLVLLMEIGASQKKA